MRYVKNSKERSANKARRKFLDMIAKSGVSAALLKSSPLALSVFTTRYAQAAPGGNKRAAFFFIGDGSPPGHWLPSSVNDMSLSTVPYGNQAANGVEAFDVANYCHFHEVMNSWGSHGQTFKCMGDGSLGANQYVDTMDSQLAKHNTWMTRFPIVRVGINQDHSGFSVENGQVATFKKGASILFNDLFGGVSVDETDTTYQTIFEMNAQAIDALKTKLAVDERERMDTHLDTMDKIRVSLSGGDGGNSPSCAAPNFAVSNDADIVKHGKLVCDILIEAYKCELMSITSVMVGDDQCNWKIDPAVRPLLNLPPGTPDNYHSAMHSVDQTTLPGLGKFLSVISQVPAYFISKLVNEVDSTGTPLIDSTLVCQLSDMGYGADHRPDDAPWILAGPSAFGLGSFGNSGYSTNTQVLASIPERMGLDGKISG